MIDTFLISNKLKRTYTANSFIYYLKSIPIIKRFVKNESYKGGILKSLAKIYSVLNSVFSFCISELIYIAVLYLGSIGLSESIEAFDRNTLFTNVFFILAIIGIFLNNILLEASQDKFYAIMILRMDARKFVLSDMVYKLIRKFVGNVIGFLPVVLLGKLNPLVAVAFILITVLGKFIGAYIRLKFIERDMLGKYSGILVFLIFALLLVGGFLIGKSIAIPVNLVLVISAVIILAGIFGAYKIFTYKNYRNICRFFLTEDTVFAANASAKKAEGTKTYAANAITFDADDSKDVSNKSGYAFFHELFVKRHKKLLWKRTKLISIIIAAFGAGIISVFAGLRFVFDFELPFGITRLIFVLPFAFYFLNTGESLSSAMFANCDVAMLSYNFYRKPEVILGTFRQRLKTVVELNIIPALLIALVLSGVCAFSLDSANLMAYASIWITSVSLSVFFSVHRLVIYYLLQPYTEGLENKRASYSIANGITYFAAYEIMQLAGQSGVEPILFSIIAVGFSIIYVVVSLILVYKLAPKRFRIHK